MRIRIHQAISLLLAILLAIGMTAAAEQNAGGAIALADGVYEPDSFSWSGGSGRVSISCGGVTVSDGKATATIVFSSPNYGYVKVNGEKYNGVHDEETSAFEIPVTLNQNNTVVGMTTKMSTSHEIAYTIYIGLGTAGADDGLRWRLDEALESAELFCIHHYEDGLVAVDVADEGRYLFVPQGVEVPAALEREAVLVQMPVCSAYVASDGALALLDTLPSDEALASLSAVGCEAERLERIAQRMEDGGIVFAGGLDAPEYATLLKVGCDFAILPEANGLAAERLTLLGIPVFVDRSGEEATAQGWQEWIKLYGVIFGCETLANDVYEQMKNA